MITQTASQPPQLVIYIRLPKGGGGAPWITKAHHPTTLNGNIIYTVYYNRDSTDSMDLVRIKYKVISLNRTKFVCFSYT